MHSLHRPPYISLGWGPKAWGEGAERLEEQDQPPLLPGCWLWSCTAGVCVCGLSCRYAFNIVFNILNKSTLNVFPAPWFLSTFQLGEPAGVDSSLDFNWFWAVWTSFSTSVPSPSNQN